MIVEVVYNSVMDRIDERDQEKDDQLCSMKVTAPLFEDARKQSDRRGKLGNNSESNGFIFRFEDPHQECADAESKASSRTRESKTYPFFVIVLIDRFQFELKF